MRPNIQTHIQAHICARLGWSVSSNICTANRHNRPSLDPHPRGTPHFVRWDSLYLLSNTNHDEWFTFGEMLGGELA